MQAVQFDEYGDVSVLEVREVADPAPGAGEVLVRVKAAAINPGEIALREGVFADRWPATFPSGQGSDLAGVVEQVGAGVDAWSVGDEVLGWVDTRSSQAELAVVPAEQLAAKPSALSWEVAGTLFVGPLAGVAAVEAVAPQAGEVVVVSGAAGGAGGAGAQLAVHAGATVIGLASASNHEWLRSRGIVPVAYGDGQRERIIEGAGGQQIAAFADTFGQGYADLALELGVPRERVSSIIDFAAGPRLGITVTGSSEIVSAAKLAWFADLVVSGAIEIPIAAASPLTDVRTAYTELAKRHTRGKVVLLP